MLQRPVHMCANHRLSTFFSHLIIPHNPSYFPLHPSLLQQDRNQRPPKGDVNGTWEHDLYNKSSSPRSLSARLSNAPQSAPKMNFGIADKALKDAVGDKSILSIKGASSRGNVVQVSGLVRGTSAADVEVKRPLLLSTPE